MTDTHWISDESLIACTHRNVIVDATNRIETAQINAWIGTFHIYARLRTRAVTILYTFGTTVEVWISKVILQAFACSHAIALLANGIRATRRGMAWINRQVGHNN